MVDPHTGVKRQHARSGFLVVRTETVRTAIVGRKGRMRLKNKIHLPGKPKSRALEMRKHRFRIGSRIARRVRWVLRLRSGLIRLCGEGCGLRLCPAARRTERTQNQYSDKGKSAGHSANARRSLKASAQNENEFQFQYQYHEYNLAGGRPPQPHLQSHSSGITITLAN